MIVFVFTEQSKKIFDALDSPIQQRIRKKLIFLKDHPEIFRVLVPLHHFEPATHRLRIGNYRVVLELKQSSKKEICFRIIDIDHRSTVYRS